MTPPLQRVARRCTRRTRPLLALFLSLVLVLSTTVAFADGEYAIDVVTPFHVLNVIREARLGGELRSFDVRRISGDPLDSDKDELTDDVEAALGTDPHDEDSDDDTLFDSEEAPDGVASDSDGDGIPNYFDAD